MLHDFINIKSWRVINFEIYWLAKSCWWCAHAAQLTEQYRFHFSLRLFGLDIEMPQRTYADFATLVGHSKLCSAHRSAINLYGGWKRLQRHCRRMQSAHTLCETNQ